MLLPGRGLGSDIGVSSVGRSRRENSTKSRTTPLSRASRPSGLRLRDWTSTRILSQLWVRQGAAVSLITRTKKSNSPPHWSSGTHLPCRRRSQDDAVVAVCQAGSTYVVFAHWRPLLDVWRWTFQNSVRQKWHRRKKNNEKWKEVLWSVSGIIILLVDTCCIILYIKN